MKEKDMRIMVYESPVGELTLWRKEYRKGLWAFYSESWRWDFTLEKMVYFKGWNLWDLSPRKTGHKRIGIL